MLFHHVELISARDGEVYLASSSSRFTIRKRPAADPPLLETCTVPQHRRKHHCSAVVSARRLFVLTSMLSATPCSPVHTEARVTSQIPGYYARRSRSSLVETMYRAQIDSNTMQRTSYKNLSDSCLQEYPGCDERNGLRDSCHYARIRSWHA